MARSKKVGASHRGGFQLPLDFLPESGWIAPGPGDLPDLRRVPEMALDTENRDDGLARGRGPGWATGAGHVCGASIAWGDPGDVRSMYLPIGHPDTDNLDTSIVGRWIADHVKAGVRVVFHNAGYDLGWMRREWGIDPSQVVVDDTTALAVAVDENRYTYRLDDLCAWRSLPGKDETLLREAANAFDVDPKSGLWRLPARFVATYAAQDAAATLNLARSLRPALVEENTIDSYQLEMDLVPCILEMRWRGVRVDLDAASEAKKNVLKLRDECLAELGHNLGTSGVTVSNCRSPDWLDHWFAEEGVPVASMTKSGRGSFTADWMRDHEHWLPRLVSRAAQLDNIANKFLQGFIIDYAHDGRLHATINQYRSEDDKGTRTTRLSYSDPPLQQMPARDDELAQLVRGAFVPEDGEKWLGADYSQQELRLMVHYAAAKNLSRAREAMQRYIDEPDTDFHKLVIEWTGLARKPAKNATFAKAFGAGVHKFAAMIGVGLDEGKEKMAMYDREMPFVQELSEEAEKIARRRGFIVLLDGARSHFDKWEPAWRQPDEEWKPETDYESARLQWPGQKLKRANTRKGMSRLIQGGAARQTKMAMRACWREGYVALLQMHDELDFSIGEERHGTRIVELMRDASPLRVPSKVDGDYGIDWGQATHDVPDDEKWRKLWQNVPARVG